MSISRSSIRLIGAGTVVQALSFLLLPLISHLYTKEELGILGTILGLAGVLGIAANGRYEQAIVMARDGAARLLLTSTWVISLAFCALLTPLFLLLQPIFLDLEGYADAVPYLWFVPFLVWAIALANSSTAIANQHKRYRAMGTGQVVQGITNNGLKIGLGYAGASVGGLISSALLGFVAMSMSLRPLYYLKGYMPSITSRRMLQVCRTYSKFPRYGILQAVTDTLLGSLLVLLLPLRYDMGAVGLVTMAAMIARRPLWVISDSFSRIYCRHFAELRLDKQSMQPAWWKYVRRALFVAIPASAILYVTMPWLVKLFLGSEWMGCVPLLRWMLPMLGLSFLTSTFNFLPDLFGRQRLHLRAQLSMLASDILVIVAATHFLPFESFIEIYYSFAFVQLSIYLYWLYRVMMRYERSLHLPTITEERKRP